jgi:hypothetical protein
MPREAALFRSIRPLAARALAARRGAGQSIVLDDVIADSLREVMRMIQIEPEVAERLRARLHEALR